MCQVKEKRLKIEERKYIFKGKNSGSVLWYKISHIITLNITTKYMLS